LSVYDAMKEGLYSQSLEQLSGTLLAAGNRTRLSCGVGLECRWGLWQDLAHDSDPIWTT